MGPLRRFGFNTTVAVIVGGIIGSGIFMKPALMASQLGSPLLLLSVWVVAGIITLFGALSNAELSAMYPETGGSYVYLQKVYGEGFAFLYGWSAFAVFNTAGTASIAYVFAHYSTVFIGMPELDAAIVNANAIHIPGVGTFSPLQHIGIKGLTIALILLFSVLNYFSAELGGGIQRMLTLIKAMAIGLLILGLFFSGAASSHGMFSPMAEVPTGWALVAAYVAALSGAFWAYDGWNNITFIAGEVKEPQRNIPRGLLMGLGFCIVIYVLVTAAYLYVLPIGFMATAELVASDAARVAWHGTGAALVAALVMLSTLGSASSNILTNARVSQAVGAVHPRLAWLGRIRHGPGTPGNAIVLHALWMIVLVFSGSFDMLTDMLVFVSWLFYGALALAVIILRIRERNAPRAYIVPGYPWVPMVFVLFAAMFLVITLWSDITNYIAGRSVVINSVLGLLITLIGLPIYLAFRLRS